MLTPVYYRKLGFKGVYISWTFFPDGALHISSKRVSDLIMSSDLNTKIRPCNIQRFYFGFEKEKKSSIEHLHLLQT